MSDDVVPYYIAYGRIPGGIEMRRLSQLCIDYDVSMLVSGYLNEPTIFEVFGHTYYSVIIEMLSMRSSVQSVATEVVVLPFTTVPLTLDVMHHTSLFNNNGGKVNCMEEGKDYLMADNRTVFIVVEAAARQLIITGAVETWETNFRREHM